MDRKIDNEDLMTPERFTWIIKGLNFDELTDWESRFVEDMEKWMKKRGDLSDKQEEILERIFQEKQ